MTRCLYRAVAGASSLMRRLKIDDPLDAFAVHGACGVWGLLAVGIFTEIEYSCATTAGTVSVSP